eukprot:gb/GECH01003367.1/.p1 GENE.gb/GECH01003367.1/~~gb/GECH01003367.1/.p1  ORF type:complete len:301 (+),score=53.53 gb/GECH01003367.1/:1-903(+)
MRPPIIDSRHHFKVTIGWIGPFCPSNIHEPRMTGIIMVQILLELHINSGTAAPCHLRLLRGCLTAGSFRMEASQLSRGGDVVATALDGIYKTDMTLNGSRSEKEEEEEETSKKERGESEDIDNRSSYNSKDEVFAMYSVWSSAFGLFFIFMEMFTAPFQQPGESGTSILSLFAPSHVLIYCCIAGLCHALYNAFSLKVLIHVAAVTHAVGNCMKRVVVLMASFVIFGMHMTGLMVTGSVVAIIGVFLYSVEKTQPKDSTPILPGSHSSSSSSSIDYKRYILRAMPFICILILLIAFLQNN